MSPTSGRTTQVRADDWDIYFGTTGNVNWLRFAQWEGKYHLFSRKRKPLMVDHAFMDALEKEVVYLGMEQFDPQVATYLGYQHPYLRPYFTQVVQDFRVDASRFRYQEIDHMPHVWWTGIMDQILPYEAIIMATMTELNAVRHSLAPTADWEIRTRQVGQTFKAEGIPFAEGGTRRRLSRSFHKAVLQILKEEAGEFLRSTSNPSLAYELGLWTVGTYPHAFVQLMAAAYGYEMANIMALIHWTDVYGDKLGTMLTDTFTTAVGLKAHEEFENRFPQRVGWVRTFRNDSLPPQEYVDIMTAYCHRRGIDPATVTIIHSDSLDLESTKRAAEYTRKAGFKVMFIIGTYLTHTLSGHEGYDLKAQLVYVRPNPDSEWIPVCKLSDVMAKRAGPDNSVDQALEALGITD